MMTMRARRRALPAQAGFSLLEILIVIAILLIMAAFAAPLLMRAIASYRLESTARGVSGLIQRTRYEAMRRNRTTCTAFEPAATEGRYFMDLQGATPNPCTEAVPTANPGEPAVATPLSIGWYNGGAPDLPPDLNGLPAGYTTATMDSPDDYRVIFSPRGTAMVDDGAGNLIIANQIQAICILGRADQVFPDVDNAVLITVTPVGNVKLFRWHRTPGGGGWAPL